MLEAPAPIVIGLDETAASRAALRFALQEAERRQSTVEVVTAWSWSASLEGPRMDDSREWARAAAQQIQDDAVATVLREVDGAATMTRQLVEGDAAQVLTQASRAADYLVVGTGRKGALRRVLLGSVSAQCVRRAPCPVVVVPPPSGAADSSDSELVATAAGARPSSTVPQ